MDYEKAKKIRRRQVSVDTSNQPALLFEELEDMPRPRARNGSDDVIFKRPDPRRISLGGVRLDAHLNKMGLTKPFIVRDMLQAQDWSAFAARYSKTGRRPYGPDAMTGLILYGIMKGVGSLRELERMARADLECMWVTGGICPDHSIIGRFILNHEAELQGGFLQTLTGAVLKATGSDTQELAGDGTVIQAAVSRYKTLKREALERRCEEAAKRAAEKPDDAALEAKAGELQKARKVLEERAKARKAKGKPADKMSVAPGEPDAVIQPQKNKSFAPSYKPSVLANTARVVVGFDLHPCSETAQLDQMHDQAEAHGEVRTALYDAGYCADQTIAMADNAVSSFSARRAGRARTAIVTSARTSNIPRANSPMMPPVTAINARRAKN